MHSFEKENLDYNKSSTLLKLERWQKHGRPHVRKKIIHLQVIL
jgi:hypothetical protein